ncbi:Ubp5-interacting protein [Paramyrothecium foliicola]|nr:Ubp5-interacting protein [Paramyrothecium foliicola]
MGASDSKIVFKRGIFRLSEERHIPADDPYWTSFWELPETSEDIFSLFAPADIRRTRDQALENIETLILAVTSRLFILRHHPSFPDPEIAPEKDALNCVRVLTRLLPYLYEKDSLASWEERFFWGIRRKRSRKAVIANEVLFDEAQEDKDESNTEKDNFEEAKPLAEELIDTLVDLLFFSDLTLPPQPNGRPKVSYAIWQSGVGCNTAVATTKEYESNRCEILRLLLTMAGQSMYMTAGVLPQRGVRTLTHICTCSDKQAVLSMLCSLLNTTLKYNPASWRVPYNTLVFKDTKQMLVTYSSQFLLAMLLYPIPENSDASSQKNFYRHFLGRLHRPQDFQFIVDGLTRVLNQPLQEKSSYLPGSQNADDLAPQMLMLFWEITQCNKRFRSFIIDTDRAHDFVVLTLFYASEYKNEPSKQGVVRMCAFLLQTLSVEPNFGINLNKTFEGQESLPPSIRITGFRGTYTDFLIHSIYNLITTSQGRLSAIYPALLAVINNIAPYIEGLSATGSSQLLQLFSSISSPSFLLANDSNHNLLHSLLDSISSTIEHKYRKNPELVLAILKNKKRIEALRTFTLESGQEEIERRNQSRKDSVTSDDPFNASSLRSSLESVRSPTSQTRKPSLDEAPEESAFAIGDDDDDDDEGDDSEEDHQPTPAPSTSSENPSQASSAVNAEDALPTQLRGMSEKARGKLPAGMRSFSRQNSTTSLGGHSVSNQSHSGGFEPTAHWLDSWLPELPLHTVLAVIQQVSALLPQQEFRRESVPLDVVRRIQKIDLVGIEPSPVRVHSFEWSELALGWYESLLWGIIFTSEMQIAKGAMNIWMGTAIKLFRVQETAPEGPTLTSPRGAVDAVGSNLVSRIGQINLPMSSTEQAAAPGVIDEEVKPYKIHTKRELTHLWLLKVSSKYLDLTRQKLELTRLPHETAEPKSKEWWAPKQTVEPLIDFWLEQYSWRDKEKELNESLPQFRTSIQLPASDPPLRIHCVHVQSPFANAVPLLLIPPFPFTNLSLGHMVSLLTDPDDATTTQPFHLVIPSLPGLGFSDALPENVPMVSTTATILDLLMKRLGYEFYLTSTSGSSTNSPSDIDWQVINHLSFHHSESCLAVHLVAPPLQAPTWADSPVEWAKWKLASSFGTAAFGYTQEDIQAVEKSRSNQTGQGATITSWLFGSKGNTECEPNTLAYALCDSPTGLLLFVLTILRVFGPRHKFTSSDIITMTELTWLPGPEAALRFWAYCAIHTEAIRSNSVKPKAAVTVFLGTEDDDQTETGTVGDGLPRPVAYTYSCPAWASTRFQVLSTNRLSGKPGLLAWERPQAIADGVRALAKAILASDKRMQKHELPGTALLEQVVVHGGEQTAKAEISGTTVQGTLSNSSDLPLDNKGKEQATSATASGHLAPPSKQPGLASPATT